LGQLLGNESNPISNEILYYEILDIPVKEMEQKREFLVTWRNLKSEPVQTFKLLLPKISTLKDVSAELMKLVTFESNSQQIRFLEVDKCKIHAILPPEEDLASLSNLFSVYAEEVPEENIENSMHLYVSHYTKSFTIKNIGNSTVLSIPKVKASNYTKN
jgi:ubiquitin carboxyl-terminal hydrolase 7